MLTLTKNYPDRLDIINKTSKATFQKKLAKYIHGAWLTENNLNGYNLMFCI